MCFQSVDDRAYRIGQTKDVVAPNRFQKRMIGLVSIYHLWYRGSQVSEISVYIFVKFCNPYFSIFSANLQHAKRRRTLPEECIYRRQMEKIKLHKSMTESSGFDQQSNVSQRTFTVDHSGHRTQPNLWSHLPYSVETLE